MNEALRYAKLDNPGELEPYLPGISEMGAAIYWFDATSAEALTNAIAVAFESAGLRPIRADFLERVGALSYREVPNESVGAVLSCELLRTGLEMRATISWIDKSDLERALHQRLVSQGKLLGALSFLPKVDFVDHHWAKAIPGLFWVWMNREWLQDSTVPTLNASEIAATYVRVTLRLGGIPALTWADPGLHCGIALIAAKNQAHVIADALSGFGLPEDTALLTQIRNVGVNFDLSP